MRTRYRGHLLRAPVALGSFGVLFFFASNCIAQPAATGSTATQSSSGSTSIGLPAGQGVAFGGMAPRQGGLARMVDNEQVKEAIELLDLQKIQRAAELMEAKAHQEQAQARLVRLTKMHQSGQVPAEELENAAMESKIQQARVMAKDAGVKEVDLRIRQTKRRLASGAASTMGGGMGGMAMGGMGGAGMGMPGMPGGMTPPGLPGTGGLGGAAGTPGAGGPPGMPPGGMLPGRMGGGGGGSGFGGGSGGEGGSRRGGGGGGFGGGAAGGSGGAGAAGMSGGGVFSDPRNAEVGNRLDHLEKKLDDLTKLLDSIRKEIHRDKEKPDSK
jgi:hypothetical protein